MRRPPRSIFRTENYLILPSDVNRVLHIFGDITETKPNSSRTSQTKKALRNNQSASKKRIAVLLLHAENRILGRLGDTKLHDAFGLDLNRFAGGRIAADAGLAIDQHELAETGDGEGVFGVLVSQG